MRDKIWIDEWASKTQNTPEEIITSIHELEKENPTLARGLRAKQIFLDSLEITKEQRRFLERILTMTVPQMRSEVAKMYDGKKWKDKVAKMPDDQVKAIYLGSLVYGRKK